VQNQWCGSPPKTCPFPYWLGLPNLVFLRSLNGISVIKEMRVKIWFLPSRLWRSLKVIGTHTDRSAISDFLLLCQLYGTISYRFRDKRRLQSKIAKFSHPRALCAPEDFLGIGYQRSGSKTRMMELPAGERSLTISSAVWIQYTNVTDGRTDRHRVRAKAALTHSVAR